MRFRWTGRRAFLPIEGLRDEETEGRREGKEVVFLRCGHPDIAEKPVVVKMFGDGELLRYLDVGDYDWRKVVFEGEELKGVGVVTFEVSRTWNPKRMGISGDGRDLGVAVVIP
ncbi:MAG: hypothetical protein U5R49_06295 [Deltaproteobacteria bacterium]|nr:hypothetical protein [Deltaproteobacteria bacterium]